MTERLRRKISIGAWEMIREGNRRVVIRRMARKFRLEIGPPGHGLQTEFPRLKDATRSANLYLDDAGWLAMQGASQEQNPPLCSR